MPTTTTNPSPSSSASPLRHSVTSPLSAADRALLHTISDPTKTPAEAAAELNLSELDLALWLAQPHIQQALEALRALRDHHNELWRDAAIKEAVETLRTVARTSEDPIERRRAASAIIRALRPHLPPSPGRGGREEMPSEARQRGAPPPSPRSDGERAGVRGSSSHSAIGEQVPNPPPPELGATPTETVENILDHMQRADDPDAATDAVYPLINPTHTIDCRTPKDFRGTALAYYLRQTIGHTARALSEPRINNNYALIDATITARDGEDLRLTFAMLRLLPRKPKPYPPWCLDQVDPTEPRPP